MFKKNIKLILRGISVLIRIEKAHMILVILTSVINPLIPYINIFMTALILNELTTNKDVKLLIIYIITTILLNMIFSLTINGLNHLKEYHQNQFFKNEKMYFSKKTMSIPYQFVEDHSTNALRDRINVENQSGYNAFYLYNAFSGLINGLISIAVSISLIMALLINGYINIFYKIIIILLITVVCITNSITTKKKNKITNKMYEDFVPYNTTDRFYSEFLSNYNSGKDIRMYSMEDFISTEQLKYNKSINDLYKSSILKSMKYTLLNSFAYNILNVISYILILFICVEGNINVGSITMYVSCIIMFIGALNTITSRIQTLINNNKYLIRYFEYLDLPSQENNAVKSIDIGIGYNIEFKNVSFKYPGTDKYVIKNFCFKVIPGKHYAIVGMNGSGKTTLIKLLCRFYDIEEGEITLNNINIKEYDYSEYVRLLGVVFQDFKIFSFNVGQNVATEIQYDSLKVSAALQKAGINERFMHTDKKLETPLYKDFEEDGIEISGGEAQKIAIARALYKDASILILDEPTAALDPIAEYEIFTKINEISINKTAIYISHRLASCRFCDEILVMHEGELIQFDSHDNLLKDKDGKYFELWNAQAQYYEK